MEVPLLSFMVLKGLIEPLLEYALCIGILIHIPVTG